MKLVLIIGLLYSVHSLSQDKRVLIVGDSWAQFQFLDQTHEDVFTNNGYGNIEVLGLLTTELGTRASDWAKPDQLQIVIGELINNPTIDTVQITLGGNDFLGNWTAGMPEIQMQILQQQIVNDLNTVIEAILSVDSDIEIILSFYDYPNFVDTIDVFTGQLCRDKWQGLGEPSAFEINSASQSFEQAYLQLSQNNSRVYHVDHQGLMQAYYGFPDDGIAPGQLMPPGDLNHPGPLESMRDTLGIGIPDCFHLSPQSHEYLIQNLFDGYFQQRFDTVFKSGFQ
ncbi:MAG: SGNH/GDSL hydrolase family protein [Marinicellaceae bacterium]